MKDDKQEADLKAVKAYGKANLFPTARECSQATGIPYDKVARIVRRLKSGDKK